ncbi:hypothetical protein BDR03DRAFT_984510 [Suillus americanus]|nr:hypothetical protein BDR03DRAFT_984510 [Suillus americanus]
MQPANHPPEILGCSLTTFNNVYIDLVTPRIIKDEDYYRSCILGLSGKDITWNIQYSIKPTRNRFHAPREVTVVRDYDSFLSFTDWLPVKADLFIYPINNPIDTLRSSLHFKVPMSFRDGQPESRVSPHRVPNICLGAIRICTKVRLFFPRLSDPNRKDVELTFKEKKGLYEKGLMPVLRDLSPDTVTNWPVNYEGAQTHARKAHGLYQYGTRPFPGARVRRLGWELVDKLEEEFPWAKGMLFMCQMQGVKEAHQHHPDSMDRAEDALKNALSDFHYNDLMEEPHCYVDVGLELAEPGYAYQWRTDAHCQLLQAFTDLPLPRAQTLMKSRNTAIDYSSGLIQLSGCRIPIPTPDANKVYFQAYTTDKALIQQKDRGRHSLSITGKAALEEEEPPYLNRLYDLYFDAKDNHDCTACVEVCIKLKDAFMEPMDFPAWLMRDSLQWRLVRLTSIIHTLRLQNQGPPDLRFTSTALTLIAGIVWLANGLHSHPDDGSAARDLIHTSYKFFFGSNFNVLRNKFNPTAYIPCSSIPKTRIRTQKGMSKRHRADIPEPSAAFATLEYDAPPPPQDTGEDLPFDEQLDLPAGLEEPFAITITKHWNQFCSDVLQKCGNMKGNPTSPSHCRLTMHEHLLVTKDIYKETNLVVIFTCVQWKRAHPVEWHKAFNKFFPPPSTPPRLQPQNYPNMTYWMQWADMKGDTPAHIINQIRTKYWALFKQLYWIPKPYADCLWKYTEDSGFVTLPSTWKLAAPHVIINPGKPAPTWEPAVDEAGEFAVEEEEEVEVQICDPDYMPAAEWIDNVPPIPMHIYMRKEEEESSDMTNIIRVHFKTY